MPLVGVSKRPIELADMIGSCRNLIPEAQMLRLPAFPAWTPFVFFLLTGRLETFALLQLQRTSALTTSIPAISRANLGFCSP